MLNVHCNLYKSLKGWPKERRDHEAHINGISYYKLPFNHLNCVSLNCFYQTVTLVKVDLRLRIKGFL